MPKIPPLNYKLIIFFTFFWPILQIFIFRIRFASVEPQMILESLNFIPLGLASALMLSFFLKKVSLGKQKIFLILGYILAIPASIFTSLLGGLIFYPAIGVTIYGLVPLFIGSLLGFLIAKRFSPS